MHLVDGDRLVKIVGAAARRRRRHPLRQRRHQRGGIRAHLRLKGVRIGFQLGIAVAIDDFIFVQLAGPHAGQEQLPNAVLTPQTHRMAAAVPEVELPHHRDALGVGRPDRKTDAVDAIQRNEVGAQPFIGTQMRALGQ